MIYDDMIHGAWAETFRPARIELQTAIVPHAVAEAVWEEAAVWLEEELPRSWIPLLVEKAEVVSSCNPRFRRMLRLPGNAGRDWLWAFMRHWLAALIWKHRRDLYSRLTNTYNVGHPVPGKRPHTQTLVNRHEIPHAHQIAAA